MKRIFAVIVAASLAGCANTPDPETGKTPLDQTKEHITDACETLNDLTVAWVVDFVAGTFGLEAETAEARAKRQELCERAAAPVDPAGELSPTTRVE